jgi:hypothetical protein
MNPNLSVIYSFLIIYQKINTYDYEIITESSQEYTKFRFVFNYFRPQNQYWYFYFLIDFKTLMSLYFLLSLIIYVKS